MQLQNCSSNLNLEVLQNLMDNLSNLRDHVIGPVEQYIVRRSQE